MNKFNSQEALDIHTDKSPDWKIIKQDIKEELEYVETIRHPEHQTDDNIFIVQEVYTTIKSFVYTRKK